MSLLFLMIHACLCCAPAAATLQDLQVGMEGPQFSLETPEGAARTFADVKGGKLTLLLFWSTWSAKSEKALLRMQKLHEKYRSQGLAVVGVNADGQEISAATLQEMEALRTRLKITFPMLVDRGLETFHDYGVIALPTTVVMDGDRLIHYELSGFPTVTAETMVDFVTTAIEGGKPPVHQVKGGYRPGKAALRFYNMGTTTLKSKRMEDTAESWFRKAVEADAEFLLPRLSLARLHVRRGEIAQAREELRAVLAKDPVHPIALCEAGILLVEEGKGAEGMALFEAARKAEEAYAPCYYYAGYARGRAGMAEDALKMFAEAESVNPFDWRTFQYKGKMYEQQKDRQQAAQAYRKALELLLQPR